jgi:hypothetical protein
MKGRSTKPTRNRVRDFRVFWWIVSPGSPRARSKAITFCAEPLELIGNCGELRLVLCCALNVMKRSLAKAPTLSLVKRSSQPETTSTGKASQLSEFFDGWLRSVPKAAFKNPPPQENLARLFPGGVPLTAADVVRVSRATVRESSEHRHWPPDVVRKFMMAQVITRKKKR